MKALSDIIVTSSSADISQPDPEGAADHRSPADSHLGAICAGGTGRACFCVPACACRHQAFSETELAHGSQAEHPGAPVAALPNAAPHIMTMRSRRSTRSISCSRCGRADTSSPTEGPTLHQMAKSRRASLHWIPGAIGNCNCTCARTWGRSIPRKALVAMRDLSARSTVTHVMAGARVPSSGMLEMAGRRSGRGV